MNVNFAAALQTLGPDAAFRIANEARTPADYLLETILPDENRPDYAVQSGNMTVRPTMAGLVGMDSPYPPSGFIETSKFLEQTAKIANEVALPEAALRSLQQLVSQLALAGGDSTRAVVDNALNFLQLVVIQPHMDAAEWLRGQALCFGSINWQYNRKGLTVDYGVPAANKLATRTTAAGTAYGAAQSAFWSDVRELRRILRGGVRAFLAHPDTIDAIRYNSANSLATIAEGEGTVTFRRLNTQLQFTQDTGDTVTLVSYGNEGEIINPADPTSTIVVPFMERGKLVAIGNPGRRGYRIGVGRGAQAGAQENVALGYTHIAPTVEGGGRMGRWADLFTPQHAPWALHGRAVTNLLPVIENPELVAIATTELA